MEQFRLIIAIVVSLGIFLLWSQFFAPKSVDTPQETVQEQESQPPAVEPSPAQVPSPAPSSQPTVATQPNMVEELQTRAARTVSVETDLYRITLSEKGAAVVGMTLKNYKETIEEDSPYKELVPTELMERNDPAVFTSFNDGSGLQLSSAVFTLDGDERDVFVNEKPAELRFSYQLLSGLLIEINYRFSPDTYLIDVSVDLKNVQSAPITGQLALGLENLFQKGKRTFGFLGPSGMMDDSLEQIALKKIAEKSPLEGHFQWIALEKPYFMSSLIFNEPVQGKMVVSSSEDLVQNQLLFDLEPIPAGGNTSLRYQLFMGPKKLSLLRQYGNGLDRAINFGWVDILAKPCLWFMNFIYRFIPNYGVAIIILTIVTRLLFWPLARKSYKSMGEMRKLAPLMKEIREKYKDDKARVNQETMALYKTYKINPVSGCLPMVVQLPVFFALYRMLYQAIELRHAPFFGWIQDLSAPDRLFNFDFKIPFMEPPYGIPVMTIIMGATMLLQQKMTPTPGSDPTQAKMMMLMPIVFMVIFINFSSGLVLYWLVGNLVAISQQYFTQKKSA